MRTTAPSRSTTATDYQVEWTHVCSAESPEEAAQAIRAAYFALRRGADQFEVVETDDPLQSRTHVIDLTDPSNNKTDYRFSPQMLHRMAGLLLLEGATAEEIVAMLEKPWNWPELMTQVLTDVEYDKVASEPEKPDLTL